MMGKVMLRVGKSSTKAVAAILVLLILVGGAWLLVNAYTDHVNIPFSSEVLRGNLTLTLFDEEGNVIEVINPSSPLAVLPLSFYRSGKAVSYVLATVVTEVEGATSTYSYTVKLHVDVYYSNPSTGARYKVVSKDYTKTGSTSSSSFTVNFNIYPEDLVSYPSQGYYEFRVKATVSVTGPNGSDEATSPEAVIVLEWKPDQTLTIVKVTVTLNPVYGLTGH